METKMSYNDLKKLLETKYAHCIDNKQHSWRTNDWMTFSVKNQSYNNIKERALINAVFGYDSISYTYICRYTFLTEAFIDELLFISSPLFDITYYNKEYQTLTCELLCLSRDMRDNKMKEILNNPENYSEIFITKIKKFLEKADQKESKIDWFSIVHYQSLSRESLEKYINLYDESLKRELNSVIEFNIKKGVYKFIL